jgi:ABC-type Fe3+-siderophore transport system permease subunit
MNDKTINQKHPNLQNESFAEAISHLIQDTRVLLHEEVSLIKLEFIEKSRSLRTGIIIVAIGAILGILALATLWAAFIIWLTNYWPPALAAVVSGAGLALIAAIMAFLGMKPLMKPFTEPVKSVEALQGRT